MSVDSVNNAKPLESDRSVVMDPKKLSETAAVLVVKHPGVTSIRVYRRRWLMLFLFVGVFATNAFQWISLSIVSNLLIKYYGIASYQADWTSLVFMVGYIPLILPGAWIMDKWGLRVTVILGALLTTIGTWINVVSVAPDRFYVTLIGQTFGSVGQVFILGVPPNVAAVWFGPDQVSQACSIGVFGSQVGIALGFLIPPIMVKDHIELEEIGDDLRGLFFMLAGVSTALLILVIIFFRAKPPLPPSAAQAQQQFNAKELTPNYYQSVKRIVTNGNYMLLLASYGANVGVFYAMSTLLNQTVLQHFPGEQENAGRIGLTIVVLGMAGSVLFGVVLDRTHKFKQTTMATYILTLIGMVAYTFTFDTGYIAVTFITAGFTGFFMTGYLPVGFEFAAELTFPEPEVTSAGLLNASAQIFGIIFTIFGGWLLGNFGSMACNGAFSLALLLGAVLTMPIKSTLLRQKANQDALAARVELSAQENPVQVLCASELSLDAGKKTAKRKVTPSPV